MDLGTRSSFRELPFVTNSVVKVGTLSLLAFYIARNLRDRITLTDILFWAHGLSVITQVVFALLAGGEPPLLLFGQAVPTATVLLAGAALDAVIATALGGLLSSALRARHGAVFLSSTQFRTLVALAG